MTIEDLDRAVSSVYGGPLDEFVSRRDALVSQLRAAGRSDAAKWVKSLRKPSRQAWALNAAALEDPAVIERVERATAEAIHAQSGGGSLRVRLDDLREAIRDVATAAGRAAVDAGHTADPASLAQAVSAVVGDSDSFAALRAGRLAAIPAATGLDLVASIPVAASGLATTTGRSAEDQPRTPAGDKTTAEDDSAIEAIAAENAARRAETAASAARDRTATAERALEKAEVNAAAAEEQLRLAQQRVDATHADLDRARQDAEAAKAREREADEAAAHARTELERLTR